MRLVHLYTAEKQLTSTHQKSRQFLQIRHNSILRRLRQRHCSCSLTPYRPLTAVHSQSANTSPSLSLSPAFSRHPTCAILPPDTLFARSSPTPALYTNQRPPQLALRAPYSRAIYAMADALLCTELSPFPAKSSPLPEDQRRLQIYLEQEDRFMPSYHRLHDAGRLAAAEDGNRTRMLEIMHKVYIL